MRKIEFLEKRKRNRSLYRYSLKRPKMSLENLGRVFGGISKQRVHAIIKREKTRWTAKLSIRDAFNKADKKAHNITRISSGDITLPGLGDVKL